MTNEIDTAWSITFDSNNQSLETKRYGTLRISGVWKEELKAFIEQCRANDIQMTGAGVSPDGLTVFFASESDLTTARLLL